MTDFDTILRDWKDTMSVQRWVKPGSVPLPDMTNVQILDEFCFFCAERAEALGRNSAFNDKHLIRLFAELKRRHLFPE